MKNKLLRGIIATAFCIVSVQPNMLAADSETVLSEYNSYKTGAAVLINLKGSPETVKVGDNTLTEGNEYQKKDGKLLIDGAVFDTPGAYTLTVDEKSFDINVEASEYALYTKDDNVEKSLNTTEDSKTKFSVLSNHGSANDTAYAKYYLDKTVLNEEMKNQSDYVKYPIGTKGKYMIDVYHSTLSNRCYDLEAEIKDKNGVNVISYVDFKTNKEQKGYYSLSNDTYDFSGDNTEYIKFKISKLNRTDFSTANFFYSDSVYIKAVNPGADAECMFYYGKPSCEMVVLSEYNSYKAGAPVLASFLGELKSVSVNGGEILNDDYSVKNNNILINGTVFENPGSYKLCINNVEFNINIDAANTDILTLSSVQTLQNNDTDTTNRTLAGHSSGTNTAMVKVYKTQAAFNNGLKSDYVKYDIKAKGKYKISVFKPSLVGRCYDMKVTLKDKNGLHILNNVAAAVNGTKDYYAIDDNTYSFSGDGTEYVEFRISDENTLDWTDKDNFFYSDSIRLTAVKPEMDAICSFVYGKNSDEIINEINLSASSDNTYDIGSDAVFTYNKVEGFEFDVYLDNTKLDETSYTVKDDTITIKGAILGEVKTYKLSIVSKEGIYVDTSFRTRQLCDKLTIYTTSDSGFEASPGSGTSPSFIQSDSDIEKYKMTTIYGTWAKYTPEDLKPGWYDVSFWNVKYSQNGESQQGFRAEIFARGEKKSNIILADSNPALEDKTGEWARVGRFYFSGSNDEYVKLYSTPLSKCRYGAVRFEKNADFNVGIVKDDINTVRFEYGSADTVILDSGTYELYVNKKSRDEETVTVVLDGKEKGRYTAVGNGRTYLGRNTFGMHDSVVFGCSGNAESIELVPVSEGGLVVKEFYAENESIGYTRLNKLSCGRIIPCAVVKNYGSDDKTVRVMSAVYDESGRVLMVGSSDNYTIPSGKEITIKGKMIPVSSKLGSNLTMKMFAWDSGRLLPYTRQNVFLWDSYAEQYTEEELMPDVTVTSDYPGGNMKLLTIGNNKITYEPDDSNSDNWKVYWNFEVSAKKNRTIKMTLSFGNTYAYSIDGGKTWQGHSGGASSYVFKAGDTIRFSSILPYVTADLDKLTDKVNENNNGRVVSLCKSEAGRDVPMYILGTPGDDKKNVLFTSRHHSSESTASYVLEGVVEYILSQNDRFFDKYCIYVVPMMDIDGVENGDQGKNRFPHDHNRDYTEKIWNSVKAISEYFKDINLTIFTDFHNPSMNTPPYFYGYGPTWDNLLKLRQILANNTQGDIIEYSMDSKGVYGSENSIYGNLDANGHFYKTNAGTIKISSSFECPFFVEDHDTMPDDFVAFGKKIGKSYVDYLETSE